MEFLLSFGIAAFSLALFRIERRKRRTLEKQLRALNQQIDDRTRERVEKPGGKTA